MDRKPASLAAFFVYNPLFGPTDETEHEKLLFYYPNDVSLDQKMKYVGLSEALVNFTRTFSPKKPCDVVHTLKKRMVFFHPEPNFWIVMHLMVPCIQRVEKDGASVTEYLDSDLQDVVVEAIIRQIYKTFKLFHNSMESIVQKFSVKVLRLKLEEFFRQTLPSINFDEVDLVNTLEGINFLPLDKTLYLKVQSVINSTENAFYDITYTCFMYNYHLVWSGLEQEDLRTLYRYLTTGFNEGSTDPYFADEAQSKKASSGAKGNKTSRSGFLIGPEDLSDHDSPINVLRVFIGPKSVCHYLIVYKLNEISLVFLLEVSDSSTSKMTDLAFFSKLENYIKPHLEELSDQIGKHVARNAKANETSYRYVYFNHMNLALKNTLGASRQAITKEVLALLTDMHEDFNRSSEGMSELIVKSHADFWIVGRRSEQREFYVMLNKKDATLIDISEEVRKLCAAQFSNIFID